MTVLSVVLVAHDDALRLRWLLNALADQTLDRALWEVIVCDGIDGPANHELVASHPLGADGTARVRTCESTSSGARRNAAVRAARGTTVVFTAEACRPPPYWLQAVYDAVQRNPGAIVHGPVDPDPDDWAMSSAPRPLTVSLPSVPTPWVGGLNAAYPREAVRELGFDEDAAGYEEIDLALRAHASGYRCIGDRSLVTYHAVDDAGVLTWLRHSSRLRAVPWLVGRHRRLRREMHLGLFWKPEHLWLLLAAVGGVLARRNRMALVLAVPWATRPRSHGRDLRGRLRDLSELPGWAMIELAEIVALAGGSFRHRALVL